MELKDVILSTLAEMEEEVVEPQKKPQENKQVQKDQFTPKVEKIVVHEEESQNSSIESELIYLNSIRERLLVLFEGFQAPNNTNIEAKIDMTLNFLEYTLATIDARVEKLEKGNI
jgi:formate-dependent nitrite reductase cytochrome c552 subunit